MSNIKIEFPADDTFAAHLFGNALMEYSSKGADKIAPLPGDVPHIVEDVVEKAAVQPKTAPPPETADQWSPDDRDAEFLPWDKRIHSSKHGKVGDGTWRIVRRPKRFDNETDPETTWQTYIDDVKAELIAARDGTGTNSPEPEDDAPLQGEVITKEEEVIAPITTFGDLMMLITSNMELITVPDVNDMCVEHGLTSVNDLAAGQDDLIPVIADEIRAVLANA